MNRNRASSQLQLSDSDEDDFLEDMYGLPPISTQPVLRRTGNVGNVIQPQQRQHLIDLKNQIYDIEDNPHKTLNGNLISALLNKLHEVRNNPDYPDELKGDADNYLIKLHYIIDEYANRIARGRKTKTNKKRGTIRTRRTRRKTNKKRKHNGTKKTNKSRK